MFRIIVGCIYFVKENRMMKTLSLSLFVFVTSKTQENLLRSSINRFVKSKIKSIFRYNAIRKVDSLIQSRNALF